MRSASFNRWCAVGTIALVMACGGCSTSAPPLPADTTALNRKAELKVSDFSAEDAALSCNVIESERVGLRQAMEQANADIRSNRSSNQTAVYFSAFFLPALVATKANEEEKNLLVRAQARIDILNKLHIFNKC